MAKSFYDISFKSQLGKIILDNLNNNWCNGFLYGVVTSTSFIFLYYRFMQI